MRDRELTQKEAAVEIQRLRAERVDLMKANALLHALIGNRDAEIEQLRADKDVIRSQERNAAYERDIAELEAAMTSKLRRFRRFKPPITPDAIGQDYERLYTMCVLHGTGIIVDLIRTIDAELQAIDEKAIQEMHARARAEKRSR